MCRFMAEYSAKCLLQNTYLHPLCTTLHPLAQPKVAKVNSLLQQQIVQQNFHPTERPQSWQESAWDLISVCLLLSHWLWKLKLCPSSMLHAGSQSKDTTWHFAAVVAWVPMVESHPEGPQQVGLGPYRHMPIVWAKAQDFPCQHTGKLRGLGGAQPSSAI